ncbi:MAG: DNA internalization-related competence protein ComEC/Rec2 [Candidatus Scalindua sp.]|nr:MAG: DNA internalization-related competence protein ComEC/Rec2 [Candidatus Scalindua sp.]
MADPIIRHMLSSSLTTPLLQQEVATFLVRAEAVEYTPKESTYVDKREEKISDIRPDNSSGRHWKKITGTMKVNVYPRVQAHSINKKEDNLKTKNQFLVNFVKYGDRIELSGYLSKPSAPRNPEQFDYKAFLQRQRPHIDVIANLTSVKSIQILSRKQGNYFFGSVYSLKRKLTTIINRYVAEGSVPLVCSIVLGDREKVDYNLMDGFIKTGTIHFLAISGFHVGILVISLHFFLRFLGIQTKYLAIIIILFAFMYATITGMKTPILRASIMVATFYGAHVFNRRWDLPNSISAAVLLILIINPSDLFNSGFQLSVLAMLGIIFTSRRIEDRLWKSTHMIEKLQANCERNTVLLLLRRYCRKTFCASVSAWFAVAPLIAYHFNLVTPVALLLNIVVLPLIWCILVGGFLLLLMGGLAVPVLAPLFAWMVSCSEMALRNIILLFSSNSNIFYYTAGASWIWVFIYYVVATIFVLRKSFRIKFERMVIAVLLLLNIFIFSGFLAEKRDYLQLTCFDVKHGTAIFIQFPNGKNMLFDSGTWSNFDVGKRIVAPFLWERKVDTIDTIVISHEHEDHCNGIPSLVERFTVKNVFINKFMLQSGRKKELLKSMRKERIGISLLADGLEITGYEPAKITVLNPPDKDTLMRDEQVRHRLTTNDTSCVLLIEYLGYKIVLSADVGESGIKLLLSNNDTPLKNRSEDFVTDILQVPHHGGFIENTEELIRRLRPKYAIISGNRGIASTATIGAYQRSGAKVFKTFQDGALSFTIGKEGIVFSKFIND